MKKAWVLSYPLSAQRRLWSDWANAQADLSICWAHRHFVGFVMRWLIFHYIFGICLCSMVAKSWSCQKMQKISYVFLHLYMFLKSLFYMDRVKRIWYLSPMRAAKVQASLRIRAVSPEPSLLAHTSSESRGAFRQKARSLAPLNGWACAVKMCHDGMLEDTNSLDGAHMAQI